jgi:2-polyprenyl-3-methyl-5-hydroxy-6-metoxy-1,4-benzoquinol methylase
MSTTEIVHALDEDALRVFREKGTQGGRAIPQQGNANAAKVRRVIQLTRDLATKNFDELRILDLACGEGVYSIEAALRGAEVVAIDGRTERMDDGARIAARAGLTRLRFEQRDIRSITRATDGIFDVVYFLGILYHLDSTTAFSVFENIREMTNGIVIIDTHIALTADLEVEYRGRRYAGSQHREHEDTDSEAVRRARVMMSLDNTVSFWFTKDALVRLLSDVGFTSVAEVQAPLEPGKPENRVTLVAKGCERVAVSTYPWINGLAEDAIARTLQVQDDEKSAKQVQPAVPRQETRASRFVNGVLRPTLGLELRRVRRQR